MNYRSLTGARIETYQVAPNIKQTDRSLTGARIETYQVAPNIKQKTIAPSQERGLKLSGELEKVTINDRSLTGARIETKNLHKFVDGQNIAPSQERGLKHWGCRLGCDSLLSLPHRSAD